MSKVVLIIGCGLLSFIWFLVTSWPDERLHVTMCDVGQGDALVISLRSAQIVVDTGRNIDKLSRCLSEAVPFWDKTIETVVISHSDSDHDGALDGLKQRYRVEQVLDGLALGLGDRVRLGKAEMEVWSGGGGRVEENEDSLVMRLTYGDFTMMFTGDMGTEEELAIMSQRVITPVTVLKVAHHGSKNSNNQRWLEALKPRLALISVGDKNSYGHPNPEVLRYFEILGSIVKRTDKDGRVEVVTDGESWKINGR